MIGIHILAEQGDLLHATFGEPLCFVKDLRDGTRYSDPRV